MKLKYYLRGLGIGMIVTALILGISFSHRQGQETQILTDDQIRERAEQLGMVDSSELTLAALQNSVQQQAQHCTDAFPYRGLHGFARSGVFHSFPSFSADFKNTMETSSPSGCQQLF